MPLNFKPKDKQETNVFIETGTYKGNTLEKIKNLYTEIHTIEIVKDFYNNTRQKYSNCKNIHFHLGDSSVVLGKVLEGINEPATIWLDAHYQGGKQPLSTKKPLLDELEVIKKHKIKEHMIMIDDVRLFHVYGTTVEAVKKKLLEINPYYNIEFDNGVCENDVLIARIINKDV